MQMANLIIEMPDDVEPIEPNVIGSETCILDGGGRAAPFSGCSMGGSQNTMRRGLYRQDRFCRSNRD
jgi:hypothetical protein